MSLSIDILLVVFYFFGLIYYFKCKIISVRYSWMVDVSSIKSSTSDLNDMTSTSSYNTFKIINHFIYVQGSLPSLLSRNERTFNRDYGTPGGEPRRVTCSFQRVLQRQRVNNEIELLPALSETRPNPRHGPAL